VTVGDEDRSHLQLSLEVEHAIN